jgi:hypothetical protein
MRKNSKPWLLFPLALALALGSVVVSCATDPHVAHSAGKSESVDLNTGPDLRGRVFTTAVLSSIRSVIVFDSADRSRRVELREGQWKYDEESTELTFSEPLPFRESVVHVEGMSVRPNAFVLAGLKKGGDVFVVLGDRLAVEGLEYTLDGRTLSFREDLDLEKEKYHIGFDTEDGSSCFGNLVLSENDRFAYLEAEHRGRSLKAWYASQKEFWFLAPPARVGDPPALVKRPPTPEERERMEGAVPAVLKLRMGVSDRKLSRELGFRVSLPKSVSGCDLWSAFVEEDSLGGRLRTRLSVLYRNPGREESDSASIVTLYLSSSRPEREAGGDQEFPVSEDTLDLGASVLRKRQWGLYSSSLEEKPQVALLSSYEWEGHGVYGSLDGNASDDAFFEAFIREWIAAHR